MAFSKFIFGLISLMRPLEWSKSFGNMAIAALTTAIVFGVVISPLKFVAGFVAVALLWGGLYTLNDYTDRKADAEHPVKKARAIPSKAVPEKIALAFGIILVFIALSMGFLLNHSLLFLLCLFIMLINQILYTMKPFNFKKRPVLDLISGSLINPAFRFYAGWTLFIPAFNAPIMVLLFILGIQFGGYGLYRMSSREHDKCQNYKSTVVCFGERRIRWLCYFGILLGALAYVFLCLNSFFWQWLPELRWLGFWPKRFFILGLLSLLAFPMYKSAMRNPEKIDMKKMYWMIYLHYLLFIFGLIILFYWF
ncbi:MAG TPA: UbiA prenyltransferase family protein [archaeon]|nr:UbiA prenyltransferase family protein [archaeon]